MKKNILKFALISFFLLSNFVIYGQGSNDNNGDLEGNDPPQAPINSRLFLLAIAGIVFAIYTFRNYRKRV